MIPVFFLNISHAKFSSIILYNIMYLISREKKNVLFVDEEDISKNFSTFFHKKTKFDMLQMLNGYVEWDQVACDVNHSFSCIPSFRYGHSSKSRKDLLLKEENTLANHIYDIEKNFSFVFVNSFFIPFSLDAYGFDILSMVFFISPEKECCKEVVKKIMTVQIKKNIKNIYVVIVDYDNSLSNASETYIDQLSHLVEKLTGLKIIFLGCLYKSTLLYSASVLKKYVTELFPTSQPAQFINRFSKFLLDLSSDDILQEKIIEESIT